MELDDGVLRSPELHVVGVKKETHNRVRCGRDVEVLCGFRRIGGVCGVVCGRRCESSQLGVNLAGVTSRLSNIPAITPLGSFNRLRKTCASNSSESFSFTLFRTI
jgi:hypothetical protein